MGDGDIELCIVRILLLHEAVSSGNVSDGRYIEREQDRAQDEALWHAQGTLDGGGLGWFDAYKLISGGEVAAKPVEGGAGNIEAGVKSIEEDVVV